MGTLLFGAESLSPEEKGELERVSGLPVLVTADRSEMERMKDEVEVAVRRVPADVLEAMPHLRWYQNWFAGVEHLVELSVFRDGRARLTNASGIHAEPMTDQFFGMLLSRARNLRFHWKHQAEQAWEHQTMADVFELDRRTLLVIGYGAIGRRIGEVGRAFGMQVRGVRRRPEAAYEYSLDQLPELLPEADVVVNVLPLTDRTNRLFDARFFAQCKGGAIFSNFGRGAQVDQDALLHALDSGHLSAALLDVTDPEPLPSESPLWLHERVMITPHTGGWTDRYHERIWPLFLENVRRYASGEELINTIDVVAGY